MINFLRRLFHRPSLDDLTSDIISRVDKMLDI